MNIVEQELENIDETMKEPVPTVTNTTEPVSVKSVVSGVDEKGSYIEFEEGIWEKSTSMDVVDGYPIYAKRLI